MSDERRRSGLLFGAGAYVWWGLCPGFFPLLLPAGAPEILAHRFVWSAVVPAGAAGGRRAGSATCAGSAAAPGCCCWRRRRSSPSNWGIYIWAVTHGHVVDAALGYFINPLVTRGARAW